MLGRLSMNVEECLEAYETLSLKAFGKPRRLHFEIVGSRGTNTTTDP